MPSSTQIRLSWVLQIVAAVIMGQTLFFKFSGAPEPVHIFTTLGAEPYGRWLAGVSELVAVVLLLWPAMAGAGGLLGLGVMSGALLAHLTTKLGIVVLDDGGLLFAMGVVVWIACAGIVFIRRNQLLGQVNALRRKFLPS
ncbi:MAG: DoxX family protein [Verrucomicrobia bacterium]|nr:DoxX family protein [Verrucomicrobiota bacterium]